MLRPSHSHLARGRAVVGHVGAMEQVATERAFTAGSPVGAAGSPLSDSLSSVIALGTFLSRLGSCLLHHLRPCNHRRLNLQPVCYTPLGMLSRFWQRLSSW